MKVIKTVDGLIPVEDAKKFVTSDQYNRLSQSQKNTGNYYTTDINNNGLVGTIPCSNNSTSSITKLIGIAKAILSIFSSEIISELMPITSPFILTNAPPLLPSPTAALC